MSSEFFTWPALPIPLPAEPEPKGAEPVAVKWVEVPPFSLAPKKIVLISGGSGVGKSYFMGNLAGVAATPPTLRGTPLGTYLEKLPRPLCASVWVPQHQELRRRISVRDEAASTWIALGIFDLEKAEAEFDRLADKMEIAKDRRSALIGTLSGGERKRVGLMLRLPLPARVIYLDEPEAGLDRTTFGKVLTSILGLHEGPEAPCVIIVSHEPETVRTTARECGWECEEVILKRAAATPPADLIANPTAAPPPRQPVIAAPALSTPGLLIRATEQASNTLQVEFRSYGTWIMHLGVPALMLGMIALCQGGASAAHWAKSIFFILITGLWVGLQGGIFLFNRQLGAWREDESWVRMAAPGTGPIVRHLIRGVGVIIALFFAGIAACAVITICSAGIFSLRTAPENTWVGLTQPLLGISVSSGLMIGYGYLLGLSLSATLAWCQLDVLRRKHEPSWSFIAAPAVMILHMLFSGTYIDASPNLSLDAAGFATGWSMNNPAVLCADYAEKCANLATDPMPALLGGLRLAPLLLPAWLAVASFHAMSAKEVRG